MLKNYLYQIAKTTKEYPNRLDLFRDYLKYYYPWRKHLLSGSSPMKDRIPWITFSAISFLEHFLEKGMKVFEYGLGGSTLFFLNRVEMVVSIEHDEHWFDSADEYISKEKNNHNSKRFLIEPEDIESISDKDSISLFNYSSANEEYKGKSFHKYVTKIDEYPDSFFDVILIDGRSRPACFFHSERKLKEGGIIMWDNTERERYQEAIQKASKSLKTRDFPGPSPYVPSFAKTSIWKRIQ
jgi:hypothetical protein